MQSEGRGHNRRVCARPSKITSASRGVISDRVESSAQGNRTHFTLPIPLPLTMSLAEPEDLSVVFEVPLKVPPAWSPPCPTRPARGSQCGFLKSRPRPGSARTDSVCVPVFQPKQLQHPDKFPVGPRSPHSLPTETRPALAAFPLPSPDCGRHGLAPGPWSSPRGVGPQSSPPASSSSM